MRKYIVKAEDKVFPTVIWQGTRLVVYYLGDDPDDVMVKETRGIDFDELLLHVDRGGSVFITTKPADEAPPINSEGAKQRGDELPADEVTA